jgi:hypothetical protein
MTDLSGVLRKSRHLGPRIEVAMTPEIAIDRVRSFIRWNGEKLEHLDAGHEAIANPVGWRRGAEYWVPPATWHDIFEDDEDAAVFGAQTLRDNGLLRIQSGQVSLQCCVLRASFRAGGGHGSSTSSHG